MPQTGVIHSRNIGCPYSAGGSKQASEALFRANAEEVSLFIGLAGRLRAGHVRRRWRQGKIPFTVRSPLVPIDVVALMRFGHCCHSFTRKALEARY